MTKQMILSKLFSLECAYSLTVNYGNDIYFEIGNRIVSIGDKVLIEVHNSENIIIEFCEIDNMKITDKTVTFLLKDGGYKFKNGDKRVIRRKK